MRIGTAWRTAVLASLAVIVSGQLCMLTTCLPRLTSSRSSSGSMPAAHACCRGAAASRSVPVSPEAAREMPCNMQLTPVAAPLLEQAAPAIALVASLLEPAPVLAPPAGVSMIARTADTGPPLDQLLPAPAGLRAPPRG